MLLNSVCQGEITEALWLRELAEISPVLFTNHG